MEQRRAWLDGFERASEPFRNDRAERLRVKRVRLMRERRALERELHRRAQELQPEAHEHDTAITKEIEARLAVAERRIEHYRRRERGQRRRVVAVKQCGTRAVRQLCRGCGDMVKPDTPVGCGHIRICAACRSDFARARRRDFRIARSAFLRSCAAWRLQKISAPGGRWSDKFINLTVPHSGDPAADVRELASAWKRYCRALVRMLRHEIGVPRELLRFPYVRVQEITPSDGGHAHYHVWCFLPFIPKLVHGFLWANALSPSYRDRLPTKEVDTVLSAEQDERSRALMRRMFVSRRGKHGRSLDLIQWPVVDVQAGRNAEDELIKYLVKDATRNETGALELIEPELFATLYAALEGRRTIQSSEGFWVREAADQEHVCCSSCGLVHGKGHRPNSRIVELVGGESTRKAV